MLIKRSLTDNIIEAATEFPVIAIVGPRQSGKTTLAQTIFPHHKYISLEDFDDLKRALADPRSFLQDSPTASGLIIDEIQHAPKLLSYMQTIVDREKKKGFFIVTGSQNFLVNEAITQTLAGRIAIVTLLPLSIRELQDAELLPEKIETLIHQGFYPQVYAQKISIERVYSNYVQSYVERDVRSIKNISDLTTFQNFIRLCVGRIGQELNLTSLGNDCGISHTTAKAWISLLQASYVIFLLHPYFKNFGKRLIKAPKLYFVDTGLACHLLNLSSAEEVAAHYLRGGLVESLIISDLFKQYYNTERQPRVYFWRDQGGHEIDCIIDETQYPIPVEIKSGKTVVEDFFKGLNYWEQITDKSHKQRYLIYGGSEDQKWSAAQVLSWKSAGTLIKKIRENK